MHVEIYIRAECTIRIERIFRSMYRCVLFAKRRLLDWMEQSMLAVSVSGCRVARFSFSLDSFSTFPQSQMCLCVSAVRSVQWQITGCVACVFFLCSLCKHKNFERSRQRKHRFDYVCDLCGRRIHATAAIYKFIMNANVRIPNRT